MAVKLLDKNEWTKDGRKWIFYDYVKNLDGTRRKYKSKKFFTKTEALKAEREFLTTNTEKTDKDRNMTFKYLYTLFYAYKEDNRLKYEILHKCLIFSYILILFDSLKQKNTPPFLTDFCTFISFDSILLPFLIDLLYFFRYS